MLYNNLESIDKVELTQETSLYNINSYIIVLQNTRRIELDQAINNLEREKEEYLKCQRGHYNQSLKDNKDNSKKGRFQALYNNLQSKLSTLTFYQNSLIFIEQSLRLQNTSYLYVHRINILIFYLVAYTL